MFRRNPGRFTHKIKLLKPSAPERDSMGGLKPTTYTEELELFAMCEQKSQTRQQFIGDYVTSDTRYFVIRDICSALSGELTNEWRLVYNGFTFLINDIALIDESVPHYIQITATAVNGSGAII